MYKINTSDPRTDIYGGDPLDLSIAERAATQSRSQKFADKQMKEKEAYGRESDAMGQLAGLSKIAVLPREQKMFADMQSQLYSDVKKDIGKIRAGDTDALIAFQQKIGDLTTKAELSKNAREQLEATAKTVMTKGKDNYRKQSLDYIEDFSTNPANNGIYDFDPTQIAERFDYGEHVRKNLIPSAQKFAEENKQGYSTQFTEEQGAERLKNDLLSDPVKLRQANDDFEESEDKLGAKDAVEYIQKKYAKDFKVNRRDPVPQWIANPDGSNNVNVTDVVTDDGGEITVMNKTNNENVRIIYNKDGDVVGGIQKTRLTPAEAAENNKVISSNIAKEKAYNDALQKAKNFEATIDEATMTPADYKAAVKLLAAKIPKKTDAAYKKDALPYQESDIELSAEQAQEIAHNKFGVKPKEIIAGKKPSHVDIQKIEKKKEDAPEEKIRVKRKSDGKTGTIDAKDFNASKYDKL